jgi:DNA replication protein DnaC
VQSAAVLTDCGKSFLSCMLANAAVQHGYTALYVRAPRLLDDLAVTRGDGRYQRLLTQLARVSLLVIDDSCSPRPPRAGP